MTLGVNGDDYNKYKLSSAACQVNPTGGETQEVTANPQESAAVIKGRKARGTDDVQLTGATPDAAAQAKAAENNEKAISDAQVDAYCGKLLAKPDLKDGLKDSATKMAENLKKGDYAKATEQYKTLLAAGVITEDLGNVPFKKEMDDVIKQQRTEEFADKLNTRDNLQMLEAEYSINKGKTNDDLNREGLYNGHRSYRRANKKLEKSAHKQNALRQTFVEGKTYTIDGKEMSAKEAYEYQKKNDPKWERKAKTYTLMSDRGYATAKIINEKLKAAGKPEILDENGNIDVEKAQAFAREYASTTGNRADKNELKQLAGDLGVKEKDVKQFLKGINVDYQKDKRWIGIAAGTIVGAATTYFAAKGFAHGKVKGGTPDKEQTTIENKIIDYIDKSGGHHVDTSTNIITQLIPGTPGKVVSWMSKLLPGLGVGIPAGIATAYAVNALVNRDVNILKKDHTLAEALDEPKFVKDKGNQQLMQQIKDLPIGKYKADSPEAKMVKLVILGKAMGANENQQGKLNKQELIGALTQLKNLKAEDLPDLNDTKPGAGDNNDKPEPTVTERTVLDIGGNGFFDPSANDGKGDFLKGADGNNISQLGDGDGAVGLKGSIGHARDWEKLRNRKAPTEGNDVNAKAQYVIADEKGETTVTPDSGLTGAEAYESPSEIMLKDNTNGKDNTYKYKKLSPEEAKKYVPEGAGDGPFYILDSASDANRSLKAKNIEVYRLELQPEEQTVEEKDSDGNITRTKVRRFKYNLEQYKGYAGSNQTSMFWNHRAK